ncbi:MAG: rod shape-determining protein [Candidatus Sungbacteria bacterium RIFCSPLOWO2_02_FULL_47_9]|uniref:Cell shape-determining protein MreB n=1 Tax=Candidatus Sungbacteria bacterium RIFCSPHIGHO2_01_FULL_47_32 TaxID=1802264 RepID=A0A1G2K604_9BACT|nr:MAG: Rod shape-determining protein mreB [Parcubacteria group bacterium GW2011_GWA2_47_10]OGZ93910.1 MAG: rod shape-determining protein [Candidatus Sungbacteria bacterium RIFCSPHIGHO2_01_FULL_47_32]OGZ99162.1 MAG: rod shape-determining protein [Candidatus Sungbacteria bacterium RIFCSPHIGHO2_02_FULL_46_12]OHA06038.1 MAG: rod shape-determining protein [Candidatus Sungbacteria bacterium RIFCSPLOWO2_01_FULL_47_32]OHA09717.1 MAG: rod shape-determining protein [Candidatus Sungbacteria bacterium RIF
MINKLLGYFSKDIGIDLGTANTLVYVRGRGIVINEPSVVAVNQKTGQIVAIGNDAKKMVGRTPAYITATRPLVEGVISDFDTTEEMLRYFIQKVHKETFSLFPRPRVVIGIPSEVTEVERRAVEDAARNAGAREVYLIEEPMAAAIGVRLPVQEAIGSLVVDIGGGTSDIAVISLGGIVVSKNLRIAGDRFNDDIIRFARDEYKLLLGERTAEDIKIAIGSAYELEEPLEAVMRGRDLITGLPKEVEVDDSEIRRALQHSIKALISAIKGTIEATPPELVADIMHRGIMLVGGGSLLRGLDKLVTDETKITTRVAEDPLTAVVRGTGIVLEDIEVVKGSLVGTEYQKPPIS